MTTDAPSRVLVVANRTATTEPLLTAIRDRAAAGPVTFHLVVPAMARGLHRIVDPEVAGQSEAAVRLDLSLEELSAAAGTPVTGHVGDANPVAAISDALHGGPFDEIIISTLTYRLSRWMRIDLPSKVRSIGLPVTHVTPDGVIAQTARAA